jgi:RNA polymerase sigma factor (sigma-70 family)
MALREYAGRVLVQLTDMAESMIGSSESSTAEQRAAELLRTMYPSLLITARSLLRSDEEAEDLIQEALTRALTYHPYFEGLAYPLGYCRTIVIRLITRRGRSRIRIMRIDLASALALNHSEPTPPFSDRIADSMVVREALCQLHGKQKACVYLRYFEGLTDDEVAAIIHCTPSTVRSQLARARGRMKVQLEEVDHEK